MTPSFADFDVRNGGYMNTVFSRKFNAPKSFAKFFLYLSNLFVVEYSRPLLAAARHLFWIFRIHLSKPGRDFLAVRRSIAMPIVVAQVLASAGPFQILWSIVDLVEIFVMYVLAGFGRSVKRFAHKSVNGPLNASRRKAESDPMIPPDVFMGFSYFQVAKRSYSSQIRHLIESFDQGSCLPDFLHLLSYSMGARI